MNIVPSGRLDFCMKGASAVYGMTIVGMLAPAMVGRSERWEIEPDFVEEAPVVDDAPVVDEAAPVVDEASVEVSVADEEADESVFVLAAVLALEPEPEVAAVALVADVESSVVAASAARAREAPKANRQTEGLIVT